MPYYYNNEFKIEKIQNVKFVRYWLIFLQLFTMNLFLEFITFGDDAKLTLSNSLNFTYCVVLSTVGWPD